MFKNKNDHTIVQQFGDGMSDAFRWHLIKSIHLSVVSVFRPCWASMAIFRKTNYHTIAAVYSMHSMYTLNVHKI